MQVWPKLRLGTAALRPLKIDSTFGPKLASFIHLVNTRHKSQLKACCRSTEKPLSVAITRRGHGAVSISGHSCCASSSMVQSIKSITWDSGKAGRSRHCRPAVPCCENPGVPFHALPKTLVIYCWSHWFWAMLEISIDTFGFLNGNLPKISVEKNTTYPLIMASHILSSMANISCIT